MASCGTGTDTSHTASGGYGSLSSPSASPASPPHHRNHTHSPTRAEAGTSTAAAAASNARNNDAGADDNDDHVNDGYNDYDEDEGLPPDFDEALLAEDDPNEDDEAYRMRMADELAPLCEGMRHEEIVELLDEYARQRKEKRAAFLAEKEAKERRESLLQRISGPAKKKAGLDSAEEGEADAAPSGVPRPLTPSPAAASSVAAAKSSLGALMFGEIDAQIAASTVGGDQTQPSKTAVPPANATTKQGGGGGAEKIEEEEEAPQTPNTAAFYAPHTAEARMRSQLSDLLGEFEATRKETAEERLRQQRESAGGILAAQRNSSRLSGAAAASSSSSSAVGILKRPSVSKIAELVGGSGGGAGNDSDEDDLLCVTGGVSAGGKQQQQRRGSTTTAAASERSPSTLQQQQQRRAVLNEQNGALSSEGRPIGSDADDRAFRAKAKAMLSVPRRAPEAHGSGNTPDRDGSTQQRRDAPLTSSPTTSSSSSRGAGINTRGIPLASDGGGRVGGSSSSLASYGGGGKPSSSGGLSQHTASSKGDNVPLSRQLIRAAVTAGTTNSAAIPLPPQSALAMPPAPMLSSEAGRRIAATAAAVPTSKPAVPRRAPSRTRGAGGASTTLSPTPPPPPSAGSVALNGRTFVPMPTTSAGAPTGAPHRKTVAATAPAPSVPLSVGGFTFLKKN